jgi:hypothetical protein
VQPRSYFRGSPNWLLCASLFEIVVAFHDFLAGDGLGTVVCVVGMLACIAAAALTVNTRIAEEEWRQKVREWEQQVRDGR